LNARSAGVKPPTTGQLCWPRWLPIINVP